MPVKIEMVDKKETVIIGVAMAINKTDGNKNIVPFSPDDEKVVVVVVVCYMFFLLLTYKFVCLLFVLFVPDCRFSLNSLLFAGLGFVMPRDSRRFRRRRYSNTTSSTWQSSCITTSPLWRHLLRELWKLAIQC